MTSKLKLVTIFVATLALATAYFFGSRGRRRWMNGNVDSNTTDSTRCPAKKEIKFPPFNIDDIRCSKIKPKMSSSATIEVEDAKCAADLRHIESLQFECLYSSDYFSARHLFLEQLKALQGNADYFNISHSAIPMILDNKGGQDLFIDVAVLHGTDGNTLIHVSGTHGPEGHAGSAIQTAVLNYLYRESLSLSPGLSGDVDVDVLSMVNLI